MSLHYGAPYGFDMIEIPSYPSISEATTIASNTYKFTIEQEPDVCFVGKNSYITIQLGIVQTRENYVESGLTYPLECILNSGTRANPTNISTPYICSNPGGAIFDSVKVLVKNSEVSNIQNLATVNTLYRVYMNHSWNKKQYIALMALIQFLTRI